MGEEIALENGRISDFHRLVTLTLDPGMVITFFHLSSSTTCNPVCQISSKSKELFVDGLTYGRVDGRKFDTHIITLTSKVWKST